ERALPARQGSLSPVRAYCSAAGGNAQLDLLDRAVDEPESLDAMSALVVLGNLQLRLRRQQRIERGLHMRLRRICQTGSESAAGHGQDHDGLHKLIAASRFCRHRGSPHLQVPRVATAAPAAWE